MRAEDGASLPTAGVLKDVESRGLPVFNDDIIDLRPATAFQQGHSLNATHFEGLQGPNGLLLRAHELPPPHCRRSTGVVAIDDTVYKDAEKFLMQKGYTSVKRVNSIGSETGLRSRRLWMPSELLENSVEQLEREIGVGTALDLGCGSGRDSAYLAARGWQVVAVDRDESLVAKTVLLGERMRSKEGNVKGIVMTLGADKASDRRFLEAHKADLLIVIRFLRKSVLPLLPSAVRPGGFVIYEHFLRGCEKFGSPRKPSYMVEREELANLFRKKSFSIVKDQEGILPDGRPVIQFIAQRKGESH